MSKLLNLIKSKTRGEWILPSERIFLTSTSKLIIGPYKNLAEYSSALRANKPQQSLLSNLEAKFGRRGTDSIPQGPNTKGGFRSKIKNRQLTPEQMMALMNQHQRERYDFNRIPGFRPRLTDEYAEAASYFNSITLESHHIIEKSMITSLNKSAGDLNDTIAPCVLITGELHRRLFTPVGKQFRDGGQLGKKDLLDFYANLYSSPDFLDLRIAVQAIIDCAFGD